MKNILIKLSVFISMIILFNSCGDRTYGIGFYEYINHSGYDVTVSWDDYESSRFTVMNGETHSFELRSGQGDFPMPFGDANVASIIFDNSRIIISEEMDLEDNIINPFASGYEFINKTAIGKNGTKYHYRYTFTPEMYERAVPIEEAEDD